MILIRRSKLILIGFSLFSVIAIGSIPDEMDREFDHVAMSDYANRADFGYMTYRLKTASIWDMLKWWLQELWNEFWRNPVSSRLTLYLFIAVMLGIAIFYVVKIKYGRVLARSGKGKSVNQMMVSEDVQKVNYGKLIEDAIDQKDFKIAIRYLYLNALSRLADREIIKLKDWKTPYDYSSELPKEMKSDYSELSMLFEYVWYGDFAVNRTDFDKCRNLSEKIQEAL